MCFLSPGCVKVVCMVVMTCNRHVAARSPACTLCLSAGFCRFGDACRYSHVEAASLPDTLPFHARSFMQADPVGLLTVPAHWVVNPSNPSAVTRCTPCSGIPVRTTQAQFCSFYLRYSCTPFILVWTVAVLQQREGGVTCPSLGATAPHSLQHRAPLAVTQADAPVVP